jgi:hypothetical protein
VYRAAEQSFSEDAENEIDSHHYHNNPGHHGDALSPRKVAHSKLTARSDRIGHDMSFLFAVDSTLLSARAFLASPIARVVRRAPLAGQPTTCHFRDMLWRTGRPAKRPGTIEPCIPTQHLSRRSDLGWAIETKRTCDLSLGDGDQNTDNQEPSYSRLPSAGWTVAKVYKNIRAYRAARDVTNGQPLTRPRNDKRLALGSPLRRANESKRP